MPSGTSRGQLVQRWLLGVVLAALVGVMAVATWTLVWPSALARGEVAVGYASDFAPGTVTSYMAASEGLRELSRAGDRGPRPSDYPTDGADVFHVVRLPNGELMVLAAADQYFGWTVVWYPLSTTKEVGPYTGVFREPRRSSVWTIDGTKVFGPGQRTLDRYDFHIRADGVLVVEQSQPRMADPLTEWPPQPYDVTSEVWATSEWPSN